jgi:hypothetical protein
MYPDISGASSVQSKSIIQAKKGKPGVESNSENSGVKLPGEIYKAEGWFG